VVHFDSSASSEDRPTDTAAENAAAENAALRAQLQQRDQLVEQLSRELYRLVQSRDRALPPARPPEASLERDRHLRQQLAEIEEQVRFYQEQISTRDAEIYRQQQTVQSLSERNRTLEQVVQELPQIYRQKFAERMQPVRDKVERLQRENRQLYAELQSTSYRLAVRDRASAQHLDLPDLKRNPDYENA